jgi:hypothetical protein
LATEAAKLSSDSLFSPQGPLRFGKNSSDSSIYYRYIFGMRGIKIPRVVVPKIRNFEGEEMFDFKPRTFTELEEWKRDFSQQHTMELLVFGFICIFLLFLPRILEMIPPNEVPAWVGDFWPLIQIISPTAGALTPITYVIFSVSFRKEFRLNSYIVKAVAGYKEAIREYQKWQESGNLSALRESFRSILVGEKILQEIPEYREFKFKITSIVESVVAEGK